MTTSQICLINPPSPFLLDERVFPPLGLLKIAAILEEKGYIVHLVDLSGINNFEDAVRDLIKDIPATTFGITLTTPQLPFVKTICRIIKDLNAETKIILGGPHITLVNSGRKNSKTDLIQDELKNLLLMADNIVAGDGETGIFEAINAPSGTVIDADDHSSNLFMSPGTLDNLPLPAWHLLDMSSYRYSIEGHKAVNIISQLGCPFKCRFCGGRSSASMRRLRTPDVETVIKEIRHLYIEYGYTGFMFYDDELNVNKRVYKLLEHIIELQEELDVKFALRGFIKAELFTERLAYLMKKAGFKWILSGFESGSPRILKNIGKIATVEDNTRCIKIAREYGLKVKALMSIGHPGESRYTIQETTDWILKEKPDDFDVTIITPYPGSGYYDEAVEHHENKNTSYYTNPESGDLLYIIKKDYSVTSDYYKGNPDGGYVSYVYTDFLSAEEIVRIRDDMESSIRKNLGIPFNNDRAAVLYEHSMGVSPLDSGYLYNSTSLSGSI